MQQQDVTEVTLTLPATSIRKLRSLAMLTGVSMAELEAQFSTLFDQMLSTEIRSLLDEIDGVDPVTPSIARPLIAVVPQPKTQPQHVEEVSNGENEHSLSSEEDDGQTKSAEDEATDNQNQVEAPAEEDEGTVQGITSDSFSLRQFPDVGEDADAFLNAAMAAGKTPAPPRESPKERKARLAFDSRSPRVKILSTSEDED